jgi:uncharacterized protein RhaS with RHS repeats
MKRMTTAAVLIACVTRLTLAETPSATAEGPLFDKEGRMLAYVYADGKRDTYVYDSEWRVKIFYDRDGRATHFRYNSDGTMNTTHDSDSPKAR